MTVNRTEYTDWSRRTDWLDPKYEKPSPNLVTIIDYLRHRWGGVSLGIHGNRPIRGGETPSEHSWGAAGDWRWAYHPQYAMERFINRHTLDTEVLPFLIDNSLELHIQGIHDEGRIWRSDRPGTDWDATWRSQHTGYSGWLHIVTTDAGFEDSTPIENRLGSYAPPPPPPEWDPLNAKWALWPIAPNKPILRRRPAPNRTTGDIVKYLQSVIYFKAGGDIVIDGWYGEQTEKRVRDLQLFCGVKDAIGGAVGTTTYETWGLVDYLATH